jgi:hypothetical protein
MQQNDKNGNAQTFGWPLAGSAVYLLPRSTEFYKSSAGSFDFLAEFCFSERIMYYKVNLRIMEETNYAVVFITVDPLFNMNKPTKF